MPRLKKTEALSSLMFDLETTFADRIDWSISVVPGNLTVRLDIADGYYGILICNFEGPANTVYYNLSVFTNETPYTKAEKVSEIMRSLPLNLYDSTQLSEKVLKLVKWAFRHYSHSANQ